MAWRNVAAHTSPAAASSLLMLLLPPSHVMVVMYKVTITSHALMQTITLH